MITDHEKRLLYISGRAADIAKDAHAAYWSKGVNREYLTRRLIERFQDMCGDVEFVRSTVATAEVEGAPV